MAALFGIQIRFLLEGFLGAPRSFQVPSSQLIQRGCKTATKNCKGWQKRRAVKNYQYFSGVEFSQKIPKRILETRAIF